MSHHPTWEGLGQGMLVLVALWWGWGAYAWLTNYIAADEGVERLLMFAVMGAMLIAALAVPDAFGEHALLFGIAYAIARWLHIFIWAEANEDVDTGQAIVRLSRTALPGPALLIAAGLVDDGTVRAVLWIVGLSIDYAGPYVFGVSGFRVSAGHFAERFSLIVIIALGESIVAIGTGVSGRAGRAGARRGGARAGRGVRALVGLLRRRGGRRRATLPSRPPDLRVRIARDSYSYLHLPMIAGIVLVSLGVKKTLAHVDEPLETVPAVALFGGIALYYAGHVGFRLRNLGTVNRVRLTALVIVTGADRVGHHVDALVAVALAAALTSGVIAYEAIHFREADTASATSRAACELHEFVTSAPLSLPTVESMAGSLARLVGRSPDYAELNGMLAQAGRNVDQATALLSELMRAWPDGREKRVELVDLEHENDAVTHDIYHHLHSRPTVPFDRSDVLSLASGLDDVVDFAEEAADFLGLYRVDAPMDQAIALTDTLAAAGHEVAAALGSLGRPPDRHTPHRRDQAARERGRPHPARRADGAVRGRRRPDGRDPLEGHLRARRGGHRRVRPRGPGAARHRRQADVASRRGLASAGNHSPCSSAAIGRNAATKPGSNFVPDRRSISATVRSKGHGAL